MVFTVQRPDLFPAGTSVAAYSLRAPNSRTPSSGAPYGTPVETQTAGAGSVVFTTLTVGAGYILYAASPDRYLRINTSAGGVEVLFDGSQLTSGGVPVPSQPGVDQTARDAATAAQSTASAAIPKSGTDATKAASATGGPVLSVASPASVATAQTTADAATASITDADRAGAVNVKLCGAVADKTSHPLSEKFASVADAVAWFGSALRRYGSVDMSDVITSLSQEMDWCALTYASRVALGTAAPASNTRTAKRAIYAPTGDYIVDDTVLFRSCSGLKLYGDEQTYIRASKNFTGGNRSVLWLDGFAYGTVQSLGVSGLTGTETVDLGICISWTTAAARSTTKSSFVNVRVAGLVYTYGFAIEPFNSSRQNDALTFVNCRAGGSAFDSSFYVDGGPYQSGFRIGSSAAGNTYTISFFGCSSTANRYGVDWAGTSGLWWGGEIVTSESAFISRGPLHEQVTTGGGVRVEASQRLWNYPAGSTTATNMVVFDGVWFNAGSLHSDGEIIRNLSSGAFVLRNFTMRGTLSGGATVTPRIRGGTGLLRIEACAMAAAPDDLIIGGGTILATIDDYIQLDNTCAGQIARYPGRYFPGAAGSTYTGSTAAQIPNRVPYRDSADQKKKIKNDAGLARLEEGIRLEDGQPGVIVPSGRGWKFATFTGVAQQAIWARFVLEEDRVINGIGFSVSTASGSALDTVDAAICDSASPTMHVQQRSGVVVPVDPANTANAAAMNTTGRKRASLIAPFTCKAGTVYYAALVLQTFNSTAPVLVGADYGHAQASAFFGTTPPNIHISKKASVADFSSNSSPAFDSSFSVGPALTLLP